MTDAYPGRRLRCDGCRKRLTDDEAYDHARKCDATVSYPYRPDRLRGGEQAELEAFA